MIRRWQELSFSEDEGAVSSVLSPDETTVFSVIGFLDLLLGFEHRPVEDMLLNHRLGDYPG